MNYRKYAHRQPHLSRQPRHGVYRREHHQEGISGTGMSIGPRSIKPGSEVFPPHISAYILSGAWVDDVAGYDWQILRLRNLSGMEWLDFCELDEHNENWKHAFSLRGGEDPETHALYKEAEAALSDNTAHELMDRWSKNGTLYRRQFGDYTEESDDEEETE